MARAGTLAGAMLVAMSATSGSAVAQEPFTEEAVVRGISYPTANHTSYGNGMAFADLDGDTDPDVVLLGESTAGIIAVYENDGTGHFIDRTATAGVPARIDASGVTAADYDGDGDLDLYISVNRFANLLMRNDGDFQFVNVAAAAGVDDVGAGSGMAWGDYDGDGWIDLYLGNRTEATHTEPNRLFHNLGNGTFEEVAGLLGVDRDDDATFHASFLDYNRDGLPDLYVCNDKGYTCVFYQNHMFRNDGGTFTNVTTDTGTEACVDCMGTGVGDVDLDGYHDLYCTNTPQGNSLMMSVGGTGFQEYAATAGMASYATGWGNIFFDYDNDGYLDLYVCDSDAANRLYDYDGAFPATDVAGSVGVTALGAESYTVTAADIEGDGDLDLLVSSANSQVRLYVNHEGETRNWLKVRPVGQAPNTHAIGAFLEVTVGTVTQLREVFSGIGFKSDWPSTQHFGLGSAVTVDELRVTWPDGTQATMANVAANQEIVVLQGDSDLDGTVDADDCAASDSDRWAAPGEVVNVLLAHDANGGDTTLSWDPPVDPGAIAVWYDVLRSADAAVFTTGAVCVESDDGGDTSAVDNVTPDSGSALCFLVRAENGCPAGAGSLGNGSDGLERSGAGCP